MKFELQHIGWFIFVILALLQVNHGFYSIYYLELILLFAPLVLVPGIIVMRRQSFSQPLWLFGTLSFLISIKSEYWLGVLPWIAFVSIEFSKNIKALWKERSLLHALNSIANVFLIVGSAWTLAYVAGIRPLDFSAIIVLLTAVHFHFAGYLLVSIIAEMVKHFPNRKSRTVGIIGMVGVPLVAIGITLTQLGGSEIYETAAATIMAFSGIGVALLHFIYSCRLCGVEKYLWRIGSSLLSVGMVLAMLYAWRFYLPKQYLDIFEMFVLHGSMNAAALMLLTMGWCFSKRRSCNS